MAFRPHNVSLQHWDQSARNLDTLEAVRELVDNMVFVGGELNASEGHIYFRDTDLGKDPVTAASAGSDSLLTFRDNGRGMTEKIWVEQASRICRAADTHVDYTPDLAQTLSRFGVGINSALPPLAEDMYMVVCHWDGKVRSRFIVRMGKTLNQALYDENKGKDGYTEQLGYALLSVPEGFKYDPSLPYSAFKQLETAIPEENPGYTQKMANLHEAKRLLLKASRFKSLEALLSLFDDLDGQTGIMYVRAERQPIRGELIPHEVNGRKDIQDSATEQWLLTYLGQTYLFHEAFKPLHEARLEEQKRQQQAADPKRPAPALLEPRIRLFVEGTAVNFEDHRFIRALKESGCIDKRIEVKVIRGKDEEGRSIVLGWCTFAYQAKGFRRLMQYGMEQRSGILEGYSCCLLDREPGFQDQKAKSAQGAFLHACEYWAQQRDKKGAYKQLEAMLKLDSERPVDMPYSEADARLWGTLGVKPGPLTKRKAWRNYKHCLGGAGVIGLFMLNEKHLPVKVSKDAPRSKSLLAYARALVLKEMMSWVKANPPAGYQEDREKLLREIGQRQAQLKADKAQAAARKAAKPPKPSKPAAGPARQVPKRHSKDEANLKIAGKRKAVEQEPIECLPSPSAPARKKPSVAARIESLQFKADMVDFGTRGCDPATELMCFAHEAWSLAKKQAKQQAASIPRGQAEKIQGLLQELKAELEAAYLLTSQ